MAPDDDNPDDKKVKELLDAATRAELERWFGLPSFQQVEEKRPPPPPDEDPEVAAVRERRQKAIAAVDPALLEAHRRRTEPDESLYFKIDRDIDLQIDMQFGLVDHAMIERQLVIAEPREVEISDELKDDLKD